MNNLIIQQLKMLETLEFQVDGKPSKEVPESFSIITFKKASNSVIKKKEYVFIFEDYIIKPFEGFDFHKKFNKDIPPPEKQMVGVILRETEKMIFIQVRDNFNTKTWVGWCPRKSVKISEL